jgi:hypothetical protein
MRYIAQSTKHARTWVEAVSKSLKIEKNTAADMYARLCEFSNWDHAVQEITRGKASPTDEMVSKDILETRKLFYADVLMREFGMRESLAEYMIDRVSPSGGRKPQRFSINTDALFDDESDDESEGEVDLHKMFKSLGMGSESDMNKAMEEFARKALGESVPDDFSFDNFAERMRISKPLDPGAWYDILMSIGWDLIDESFRSDYVYGEESFVALKDGTEIPVFITSLVRAPYDIDDKMANEVMSKVEAYTLDEFEADEALLFWGQPIVKKIDGKDYAHFGMYCTEGQWHEFLMNKDTSISDVFNQHNEMESIDTPPESLCDENIMLAVAVIKISNHIDQDIPISLSVMVNKSGWNSLLPSERS